MVFLALPALAQQTAEITMNGLTATLNDGKTVQFGSTTLSYTTKTYITSIACNDVLSLEPSIGSNTSNSPSYNKNGDLRLYPNNELKFVVKEGYTISKVEFTMTQNTGSKPKYDTPTVTPGTWSDADGVYIWSSDKGVDGFTITANSTSGKQFSFTKFIITYEKAGNPDLLPADLSFGEKTAFTIALGEEFTEAPTLVNPYNLPVTYASSNEAVAMVDDKTGEVVLMDGVGTTTISAEFAGDETYNPQTVSYTITTIKTYKSIAEFNTLVDGAEGLIDFVSTVAYINGNSMYITDGTDFTLIYGASGTDYSMMYSVGDKIPAGWDATMKVYNGLPEIDNPTLPRDVEKGTFTPSVVESVNADMLNAIVILKNVTFAAATASGSTKTNFDGVVGETTYSFRNNFVDVASVEPGTYNVTLAVNIYDYKATTICHDASKLQLYPISYEAVVAPAAPEVKINGETVSDNANVNDGKLTFEVPEGIAVYYRIDPNNTPSGDDSANAPAKAASATMDNDGKVYTLYTGEVKLESGSHTVSYFAYDEATGLKSEVKTINVSNTTGIEGIAAEDGAVEWFNLQGVRVAEPQQGIYVRVANGKAAKVVVE